jgi:hypothetical protein
VRDRRTPDRHDRVADELLDRAAVAADDVGGELEVPRQRLADLLRVALLGEGGEADQVGEQDRDEPPQNLDPGRFVAPQVGQALTRGAPQSLQNLSPASFSCPQFEQTIGLRSSSSVGASLRSRRQRRIGRNVMYLYGVVADLRLADGGTVGAALDEHRAVRAL